MTIKMTRDKIKILVNVFLHWVYFNNSINIGNVMKVKSHHDITLHNITSQVLYTFSQNGTFSIWEDFFYAFIYIFFNERKNILWHISYWNANYAWKWDFQKSIL